MIWGYKQIRIYEEILIFQIKIIFELLNHSVHYQIFS